MQGGLLPYQKKKDFRSKGKNTLCCISSDLLKISVRVKGTIISESPVSKAIINKPVLSFMVGKTHEVEGLDVLFEDHRVCPRNLVAARRFSFGGSSFIPN
jgi:hypothetical protein